jgi:hypothetical protein
MNKQQHLQDFLRFCLKDEQGDWRVEHRSIDGRGWWAVPKEPQSDKGGDIFLGRNVVAAKIKISELAP